MKLKDEPPRRREWETWLLDPQECAALVEAVRKFADAAEPGSEMEEAIRPVFDLFEDMDELEVRLQVRQSE